MEGSMAEMMTETMRGKVMSRIKANTMVKMGIMAPTEMINMDITAEVTIMAMVDMGRDWERVSVPASGSAGMASCRLFIHPLITHILWWFSLLYRRSIFSNRMPPRLLPNYKPTIGIIVRHQRDTIQRSRSALMAGSK